MPKLHPLEKTSTHLHFRCSVDPENEKYQIFFEEMFSDYICSLEKGKENERPHFHCVFGKKGSRCEQVRKILKNKFNLDGNADYELINIHPHEQDLRHMVEYVCKGDDKNIPPVILFDSQSLYSNTDILHLQKCYWLRHEPTYFKDTIKDTPQAVDTYIVTKTVKASTFTEKTLNYILDNFKEKSWNAHCQKDIELMTSIVLERMGQKGKELNPVKLASMVYGFLNSVDADNLRDDMRRSTVSILMQYMGR